MGNVKYFSARWLWWCCDINLFGSGTHAAGPHPSFTSHCFHFFPPTPLFSKITVRRECEEREHFLPYFESGVGFFSFSSMVEYLGVLAAACGSNFGQLPWKCRRKKTSITQWAIPYSPSKPNVLCVARPIPNHDTFHTTRERDSGQSAIKTNNWQLARPIK